VLTELFFSTKNLFLVPFEIFEGRGGLEISYDKTFLKTALDD
jgi:hypothetical protein